MMDKIIIFFKQKSVFVDLTGHMVDPNDPKKCIANPKEEVPSEKKPEQSSEMKTKKKKRKKDRKKKKKRPKGSMKTRSF